MAEVHRRSKIAKKVRSLLVQYPDVMTHCFREQTRHFNRHFREWRKAQANGSYYPDPTKWHIEDKLCCYYAVLGLVHDQKENQPPIQLSKGLNHLAAYALFQNASRPDNAFDLDMAFDYVRADIQRKAKAGSKGDNKRKPIEKVIEKVLDEHPILERKPKELTKKVNEKLESWGYGPTKEGVVKNALTRIRKAREKAQKEKKVK